MIRVGPAGWSYADWEGRVYPRRKPRGFHPLAYLARYFDCIEINSSFYAAPSAANAERWVELVRERPSFRFTAKLERAFTHAPEPSEVGELVRQAAAWNAGVAPLADAERLAAVLVQLPHSARWGAAAQARLQRVDALFGLHRLVLEVRHRSWYVPEALRFVEDLGWTLAEIDLPAAADHPPSDPPRVGPLGYLRLHGRNAAAWFDPRAGRDDRYDHLYAETELAEIVRTTSRLAEGRDETYVVTNNHFSGKAVVNALELLAAFSTRPPLAPATVVASFPRLAPKVRTEGQPELF